MSDHALDQIVADMLAASDRWRRLHPPADPHPARTWLEDHVIFARVCDESSKAGRA